MRNEKNVIGMARFGITGKEVLGIQIYKLRALAKEIGRNHELALELAKSHIHEARLLSVFLDEPDKVMPEQMDSWALNFESWDDTDQACTSLFDQSPHAWSKVREWAKRPELFVKRAAFSIIAGLAVHDKKAHDKQLIKLLPLIKKNSTDERNYVKKAVNWALRNIGKRNKNLNKIAIKLSIELKESDNKTSRWIGSNAYNELIKRFQE
jgi:3-methyladenine DNA glycosylase AlkD